MGETRSFAEFQKASEQELKEKILEVGGEEVYQATLECWCFLISDSLCHPEVDFALPRSREQMKAGLEAGISQEVVDLFIMVGLNERNEMIRLGMLDSDLAIDPQELYGEDQDSEVLEDMGG